MEPDLDPPCCCGMDDPKNFTVNIVDEFTVIDPETFDQVELRIERQVYPKPNEGPLPSPATSTVR